MIGSERGWGGGSHMVLERQAVRVGTVRVGTGPAQRITAVSGCRIVHKNPRKCPVLRSIFLHVSVLQCRVYTQTTCSKRSGQYTHRKIPRALNTLHVVPAYPAFPTLSNVLGMCCVASLLDRCFWLLWGSFWCRLPAEIVVSEKTRSCCCCQSSCRNDSCFVVLLFESAALAALWSWMEYTNWDVPPCTNSSLVEIIVPLN